MMKKFRFILTLVLFINQPFYSQNGFGEFAKQEFNVKSANDAEDLNFFGYLFETKKQLVDFIELKKGDIVTEIGAGNGINFGVLSMVFDSITFVAQDIDTNTLNKKAYDKIIKEYMRYSRKPATNKFEMVIGTKTYSNLPDNTYDKLFVINSFHDFDKQDEMLNEIYRKLKADGQFILLEGFSFPGDTQICPDYGPHVLHTMDIDLETFEKHGFYLIKMRAPYFKAFHYGNGLIFVKDKTRSDKFYSKKNEIDELTRHSFRFKQAAIASDSALVKQITDSLKQKINDIVSVYNEFEVFIKEMGCRHLKKTEYTSAVNVFKANTIMFPNSYQAHYWLGVAYENKKHYRLALDSYNAALRLSPENEVCLSKIKTVSRKNK
ncbi:MAG: methyltransferase domain-containing protein [Bacteroidota bacterium]